MKPTIQPGEKLVVDEKVTEIDDFSRWDIAVFKSPENHALEFAMRIAAFPGDRVQMENNRLYINGKEVSEADWNFYHQSDYSEQVKYTDTLIPEGTFFALGDNARGALDSRFYGPVPESHIIGKVILKK